MRKWAVGAALASACIGSADAFSVRMAAVLTRVRNAVVSVRHPTLFGDDKMPRPPFCEWNRERATSLVPGWDGDANVSPLSPPIRVPRFPVSGWQTPADTPEARLSRV